MHLSVELILYKLKNLSPEYTGNAGEKRKLRGIKHYYIGTQLDNEYLYITYVSQLAELENQTDLKKMIFAAINDTKKLPQEIKKYGWNCILLPDTYELGYIVDQVYDIFEELKELDKDMHIASLQGADIQRMLDIAEPFLEYPFILFDTGFNTLAYTRGIDCGYAEYQETIKNGYSHHHVLEKAKKLQLFQKVEYINEPILEMAMEAERRWNLYYKLKDDQNTYGYIAVFLEQSKLPKGYYEILQLILNNLILYFQRNFVEQRYGDFAYENLLLHLLKSTDMTQEQLENQLQFTKDLSLEGTFYLAVIKLNQKEHIPYRLVIRESVSILKNTKAIFYQNNVLLLKQKEQIDSEETLFEAREREAFEKMMKTYDYYMGVSREFSNIIDISSAYSQGCQALEVGKLLNSERIFNYCEYYIHDMLLNMEKLIPLKSLQSKKFRYLKLYDEQQHVNYKEIVIEYVKCNCNASLTSKKLFLHRNTVLYAIKKIEEYLNVELEDFQVQQDLIIADHIDGIINIGISNLD